MMLRRTHLALGALAVAWAAPALAWAHGVPSAEAERLANGSVLDYMISGAMHMVTGYDHLLF